MRRSVDVLFLADWAGSEVAAVPVVAVLGVQAVVVPVGEVTPLGVVVGAEVVEAAAPQN